jgi:hypothetical protein
MKIIPEYLSVASPSAFLFLYMLAPLQASASDTPIALNRRKKLFATTQTLILLVHFRVTALQLTLLITV